MAAPVVETFDLTKRYGEITAVDRLNLQLRRGEVFGLLGPNGAGKTTTILMLLGLTEPTSGRALVCGHDPTRNPIAVKRVVGYLPDNVGFYDDMTGRQNLRYTADLNGIPAAEAERRIAALLERVGLAHAADRKVATYSRGMRQRLGLADVLLKQPQVAILDEPTLGLDPKGAVEFLDMIRQLSREEGVTVMLSSHLLHQVQQVCDRVGIFVQGKMIACGPIAELADQVLADQPLVVEMAVEPDLPEVAEALARVPGVQAVERDGPYLRVRCQRDVRAALSRAAAAAGAAVVHMVLTGRTLDDIYQRYFAGGEGSHGRNGAPAAGAR